MNGATVFVTAIGYVSLSVPHRLVGRRGRAALRLGPLASVVYALSLAVYCTSWTYYGSVGLASAHGLDFLPIYIGPILVIGLGAPFIVRIADLARAQNLTTVADFVSARYGKSQAVAAVAALIALIGSAPYIALQLKAVAPTIADGGRFVRRAAAHARTRPRPRSLSRCRCCSRVFAMAFGTRRINPKEHQDGLILAIAVELVVKLVAFLGRRRLRRLGAQRRPRRPDRARQSDPRIASVIQTPPDPAVWGVTTLCRRSPSCCCRASFTSPWSRTTTRAKSAPRPGCFRPISC